MKSKNNNSIIIKLVITAILGSMGIAYILYKPPVSEINSYQKKSMPKPYRFKSDSDSNSYSSESEADDDAISLTGSKGGYDAHLIGKDK